MPKLNPHLLHLQETSYNIPKVRQGASLPSLHILKKRKKTVPKRGKLYTIVRKTLKKDLSSQMKALLRLLFKCTSVDGKSMEDPLNFPKIPGEITLIRNMGGNLKVFGYLVEAKSAFLYIRMVQIVIRTQENV